MDRNASDHAVKEGCPRDPQDFGCNNVTRLGRRFNSPKTTLRLHEATLMRGAARSRAVPNSRAPLAFLCLCLGENLFAFGSSRVVTRDPHHAYIHLIVAAIAMVVLTKSIFPSTKNCLSSPLLPVPRSADMEKNGKP